MYHSESTGASVLICPPDLIPGLRGEAEELRESRGAPQSLQLQQQRVGPAGVGDAAHSRARGAQGQRRTGTPDPGEPRVPIQIPSAMFRPYTL